MSRLSACPRPPRDALNLSQADRDFSIYVSDSPLDTGQQIPVPDKDLVEVSRNEGGWDDEDEINQELLRLAEYDAEPGQEQFFGEVMKDCVS